MYRDVIFGWVLCIWLSSWHFFLNILIFFAIAWKFAGGSEEAEGRRRPPANFQAIAKQNQNTQKKVPTTQPNPQYSAKNNVSIHMIEAFMPKPCPEESLKYTILYLPLFNSLTFQTKLQSAMLLLLFSIQFFSLFTSVILDHKFATLEFFAKNTTFNRHQFQKFQKNTQIYHGISL